MRTWAGRGHCVVIWGRPSKSALGWRDFAPDVCKAQVFGRLLSTAAATVPRSRAVRKIAATAGHVLLAPGHRTSPHGEPVSLLASHLFDQAAVEIATFTKPLARVHHSVARPSQGRTPPEKCRRRPAIAAEGIESLTPCHLREPQGRVLICAQIAAPLWLSKKLDLIYVERLCFFPEEKTTDRIARDVIQPGIPAEMTWKHPMPLPLHDRMRVLCSRTADVRLTYWGVA
jgi:hypothetical protein